MNDNIYSGILLNENISHMKIVWYFKFRWLYNK